MGKLRKLDVAAGYVEMLKDVDTLRAECVSKLGKDDDAALEPYKRLQHLVTSLRALQDAAEGAAPHLLDHIVANVRGLRRTIEAAFSENLQATLKKMNWPKITDRVPLALEREWAANIGRLLDLQKQDLEDREHDPDRDPAEDPPALLPFEVLVVPLEQRFTYHFSGNKPTNRVDKPEYFLNHITDLVANYSDFVQTNNQPILLRHLRRSDLAFTPGYIDAVTAFITALMPMVKNKLNSVAGQVADQPALISHLVQQVIQFDLTLQDSYAYTPSSPASTWRGLSYFLLDTRGYFQRWLEAERDFALQRYNAIIEGPDAGDLDFDAFSNDTTKPTKAAVRINDVLETITERYRNLSSFSHKVKFLIDIQLEIFDRYRKRLAASIEAYQSLTTTIGRTVQGISKEEQAKILGVKGLDRICRVFGSAEYLERAMRDWSDDVFFLELWAELDFRSKNKGDRTSRNMGSWQEVQQKTSSALGTETDGGLEGALFDETANSYRRLRLKSEEYMLIKLREDLNKALRPYSGIASWASLASNAAGETVSAELDPTLTILKEYFGFLKQALGKAPLRRIARQVCHIIENYVWEYVLMSRSTFSTLGATQLTTDMRAVCGCIDFYIGSGQAQIGMRRLLEGVTLLSLPVKGEVQRELPGRSGDEEDDEGMAWEVGEEGAAGEEDVGEGKRMSLWQAERLVFRDNEGARRALEMLGLETLSAVDARAVLGKRVEVSS